MKYLIFTVKTLIILVLISAGYYFIYFLPHQAKNREVSIHYSNLVQNRTAYVGLAKLNPKDPSFDSQKSNLIDIIKVTNAKGLEKPLNNEEKRIFEKQNEILVKVFATDSYEEGVAILRSDESIQLLIDEAELIDLLAVTE